LGTNTLIDSPPHVLRNLTLTLTPSLSELIILIRSIHEAEGGGR
jgi:hypothetical protein